MYQEIDEPIETLVLFREGSVCPVKFRWNSRVYKITSINGVWRTRDGHTRRIHFSLSVESPDIFEVVFDTMSLDWTLVKVFVQG